MPKYVYSCDACGSVEDEYRTVDRRNDSGVCAACSGPTRRKITMPAVFMNHFAFPQHPTGISATDALEEQRRIEKVWDARMEQTRGRLDAVRRPITPLAKHVAEAKAHAAQP